MTTVSTTTSAQAATTTAASGAGSAASGALVGTESEFLQLFMAQLQNQDPLNPQDGADMVSQLAQFSSVEQETQTNTNLANLTATESSTANASLSSLVGRSCDAGLGAVTVQDPTKIPPINVSSSGAISGASIIVTDSNGKQVASLPIPSDGGTVQWNGKDSSGVTVAPGQYTLSVSSGTTTTPITANWHDTIDAVDLTANGSQLQMDGILVSPSDVTTIGAAATSTTPITPTTAALAAVMHKTGARS
ncbi:MAG TPA: flagellar hook capping FlgD N-terminal domain-containing protein [Kofleriaceae bacterium]|jgi:flagellar basal-body rod modification protein FlgD|nr:flagellar hook capping FlgD N-terminal domain-containing protein [Kofleriaceae bacterium]